jgi:hypothetical protein
MLGPLPNKVRNITLSGRGLTSVPYSLFKVSNTQCEPGTLPNHRVSFASCDMVKSTLNVLQLVKFINE